MKVQFDVVVDCSTSEFKTLSNLSKLGFKQFIKNCKLSNDETMKEQPHRRKLIGNETTVRRPY